MSSYETSTNETYIETYPCEEMLCKVRVEDIADNKEIEDDVELLQRLQRARENAAKGQRSDNCAQVCALVP